MNRPAAVLTSVIVLATLAGCVGSSPDAGSLADSKSPAQLLRNEAVSRIDANLVANLGSPLDESRPCDPVIPRDTMRYWHSSVNVFLEDDDSARPETVVEQMVATFVEQGWVVSEGQTELMTAMTTPALDTTMAFTRTPTESGGVIAISVDGPCAMTDGVDSPEVEELDGGQ